MSCFNLWSLLFLFMKLLKLLRLERLILFVISHVSWRVYIIFDNYILRLETVIDELLTLFWVYLEGSDDN
jgi:hypothetical protein